MTKPIECMTENFDLTSVYDEKIKPLVEQVHELCVANGIPFIAGFVVSNHVNSEDDEKREYDVGIAGSVFMNGPERTPPELVVANKALREGNDAAFEVLVSFKMAGDTNVRAVDMEEEAHSVH